MSGRALRKPLAPPEQAQPVAQTPLAKIETESTLQKIDKALKKTNKPRKRWTCASSAFWGGRSCGCERSHGGKFWSHSKRGWQDPVLARKK